MRRFPVDEFQIEVFRQGELDEVRVLVEADDDRTCVALQEAFRAGIGVLTVTLPRWELKARRVVRRSSACP